MTVSADPTRVNGNRPGQFICGVDAGATKTDCAVCAIDGSLVARRSDGPALMLGGDGFASAIATAVDHCCSIAGLQTDVVDVIAVGLAGVDTTDGQERAGKALAASLNSRVLIVDNDAAIALEAATATRPAAVVMAGTGSIGYGETSDGQSVRVGGWGHLLGDEGSGYAIGVAGCAAALKAFDGRGAPTILSERACEHFSLGDVRELVGLTERFALQPGAAAAFAPSVLQSAQQGDITARQIVDRAATHLAGYARRMIDELQLEQQGVLALGGGILANSQYYTEYVTAGIRAQRPSVRIAAFDLPPVGGAVLKALGGSRGQADAALRLALMRGFGVGLEDQQPARSVLK